MENKLREVIGEELRRRHGYGCMDGKIKPVHIANALMREEHLLTGRMEDLNHLLQATAARETQENRLQAVQTMLDRHRDRWGRLGEEDDLRQSPLMQRVLPLLRTIIGTDGATFNQIKFASFSSPTAATVTRDPSDDHAGSFIHRLWGGHKPEARLELLSLLRKVTDPQKALEDVDDLTAILLPLVDDTAICSPDSRTAEDLFTRPNSDWETSLRMAAEDLWKFETAMRPNPIASLQRIILLASLSLFFHGASRAHDWGESPDRLLLIDVSSSRSTPVAEASEALVARLLDDSRGYMAHVLRELLDNQSDTWPSDPESAFESLFLAALKKAKGQVSYKQLHEIMEELDGQDIDLHDELPKRVVELLDSSGGRSLDGFLRILGLRCGFLHPQQKNPQKRVVPFDRTLEVLVASTFDLSGKPMEYQDFLDCFYRRWHLITGGRLEDAALLAATGNPVPSADLAENSERFLSRLESLGLARKLADSVAVVGLMENGHE